MSRWGMLGLGLLALACPSAGGPNKSGASDTATADPTAQNYVSPALPTGAVLLTDAYGARHRVDVEVAVTERARRRGLMWRTSLEDGKGMLFVFPQEQMQSFWMRNTLIPLDMLFINQAHVIVGIVEHAEPRTLISRSVPHASMYVLEVPGGWAARMGVTAGSSVSFSGVPAAAE